MVLEQTGFTPDTETPLVTICVVDEIAWLRFDGNRPFDGAFWIELAAALASATELDVHCVVLTGGPTAFSVGNNIAWLSHSVGSAMRRGDRGRALQTIGDSMRAVGALLSHSPVVTVAVVSGAVIGAGAELACLADLRICVGAATIALPEPQLGVIPDLAPIGRVSDVLGPRATRRLLFFGQQIDISPTNSELFADYFCDDFADVAPLIAGQVASFPRRGVLPALRQADHRGWSAAEAAAINCRLCDPAEFRRNLATFAEEHSVQE